MQDDAFEEPVTVYVGLGYPRQVKTALEAFAFLSEWPASQRKPGHVFAKNECRAAISHQDRIEAARTAFVSFASRVGILAPPIDLVAANADLETRTAA